MKKLITKIKQQWAIILIGYNIIYCKMKNDTQYIEYTKYSI